MKSPLELSFVNMDASESIAGLVREKVDKMERLYDGITSCHVFVEAPHKQHRKGNQYEVRVEVRVPGSELAVNHKPGDINSHEDIGVTIRDAFNAMERQLRKWKRKVCGDGAAKPRISDIYLNQ